MLDAYRFILAFCVLQAHLLAWGPDWLAWQAVFSFYVLSGFLMTLILNQDYGFEKGSFVRFATNRALRLFPIYYIVIGLTALYVAFVGPLDQLNGAIALPNSIAERVANLGILSLSGFDVNAAHRLAPTAWSLSVECFCYGLLGLYFAQNPRASFDDASYRGYGSGNSDRRRFPSARLWGRRPLSSHPSRAYSVCTGWPLVFFSAISCVCILPRKVFDSLRLVVREFHRRIFFRISQERQWPVYCDRAQRGLGADAIRAPRDELVAKNARRRHLSVFPLALGHRHARHRIFSRDRDWKRCAFGRHGGGNAAVQPAPLLWSRSAGSTYSNSDQKP